MAPTKTSGATRGTIKGASTQNIVSFTIRASPIPTPLLEFILDNAATVKKLLHDRNTQQEGKPEDREEEETMADQYGDVMRKPSVKPEQFWDALQDKCKEVGGEWEGIIDKVWAFGPQRAGGCLLIDARKPKALAS
jgi:ribosome assembly protein 1